MKSFNTLSIKRVSTLPPVSTFGPVAAGTDCTGATCGTAFGRDGCGAGLEGVFSGVGSSRVTTHSTIEPVSISNSASLVELLVGRSRGPRFFSMKTGGSGMLGSGTLRSFVSVSYTHLTLPTKA